MATQVNQETNPPQAAPEQTPTENFIREIAYTRDQLRQQLGVSERTLYRRERRGDLPPCIPLGNQKYYLKDSVKQWFKSQEQQPHTHGRRRSVRRRGGVQ